VKRTILLFQSLGGKLPPLYTRFQVHPTVISFDIARIIRGTITKPTLLEVACVILLGGLGVLVILLLR
jgi:hypothetical protein